jgi:hypothetical protein
MTSESLAIVEESDPGEMWAAFSSALGPAAMEDCYGFERLPARVRHGETVWKFHDESGRDVAWSSAAEYPKEPGNFEIAFGVWPRYRRQGYRGRVLSLTAMEVFSLADARMLVMQVFDTAIEHSAQCLRDAENGSPWIYAGRVWAPDPLRLFVLTHEAWEAACRIR